jgi:hypothetical protein
MQGIFPSPGGGSVEPLGLTLMPAPLGARDLLLDGSIEMTRLELIPIAARDRVLEA